MTTLDNPQPAPSEVVTDLPSRGPIAQARARTREGENTPAGRMRLIQSAAPAVFSGSSLWHAQPPSLAQIWGKHAVSARYFEAGLIRGPRFLWGALHVVLASAAYLVAWVTSSIPLFLLTAGVLALVIWLI